MAWDSPASGPHLPVLKNELMQKIVSNAPSHDVKEISHDLAAKVKPKIKDR